jgi:hypothetical protein
MRTVVAVLIVATLYFEKHALPEISGLPTQTVRVVHPELRRIDNWTSAVGASIALGDLERTGLPNDVCYVDTRIDRVIVAPVPARSGGPDQPPRFQPFVLDPSPGMKEENKTWAPMGCVPGDFCERGCTDVLVYYWGRSPVIFLRKPPEDSAHAPPLSAADFTPVELVPPGPDGLPPRWFTNAVTRADLDGDGHIDLIVGNYHPDDAHVLDGKSTEPAEMQDSMTHAYNGGTKHVFLWKPPTGGRPFAFEEQTDFLYAPDMKPADPKVYHQVTHGWTLALGAADLDGDLLPELYIANDFGPDRLLHNRSTPGHLAFVLLEGVKHLTTPKSKVLGHDSFKGMGIDFVDLNRDGNLSFFISNIAEDFALQESHFLFTPTKQPELMKKGIAPYDDRSEELGVSRSGWGWDAKFGDFNNDGNVQLVQSTGFCRGNGSVWPWLHELATANDALLKRPGAWFRCRSGDGLSSHTALAFFARDERGHFWEIGRDIGFPEGEIGRGIATADVEGNGRLDFAVANQFGPSHFYYNTSPACKNYLGLHLLLPLSPTHSDRIVMVAGHPDPAGKARPAIGAEAVLRFADGHRVKAQVDGGNGHSGRRSPDLHFGVGDLPSGAKLQVDFSWRDGDGIVHRQSNQVQAGQWTTAYLGWPGKEQVSDGR